MRHTAAFGLLAPARIDVRTRALFPFQDSVRTGQGALPAGLVPAAACCGVTVVMAVTGWCSTGPSPRVVPWQLDARLRGDQADGSCRQVHMAGERRVGRLSSFQERGEIVDRLFPGG